MFELTVAIVFGGLKMLTGFVMARQVVHWFGSLVKMLVQS